MVNNNNKNSRFFKLKLYQRFVRFKIKQNIYFILIISIVINFFLGRYLVSVFGFAYGIWLKFLKDSPKVQEFFINKKKLDSVFYSRFKTQPFFFVFSCVYLFSILNFVFSFSSLKSYCLEIFIMIICSLLFDFIYTVYVVLNSKLKKYKLLLVLYGVVAFIFRFMFIFFISYQVFSVTDPLSPLANYYHLYGPHPLGAMGCIALGKKELICYSHILTVHSDFKDLKLYLRESNLLDFNVVKFQIHSNFQLYKDWKLSIPETEWEIYDLDKPFGSGITSEILQDLRAKKFFK